MKSNHFGTATLILGALGASFAACSTATSDSPPGGAGSGNVAGASNMAGATSGAGANNVASAK